MADYFLDDAANGTNDGASWATCYNTWQQVLTAGVLGTSGNRLFVGADANITNHGAALTIVGPTSGAPAYIISSTVGTGTTVSYSKGTGTQIEATGGAYNIVFDGSLSVYGIKAKAGQNILWASDSDETMYANDCTFQPGANQYFGCNSVNAMIFRGVNLTIDCIQDGTTPRSATVLYSDGFGVKTFIDGLTFENVAYRTGVVFASTNGSEINVSGADCSGFTNATTCELASLAAGSRVFLNNAKTHTSWAPKTGTVINGSMVTMNNVGPVDDPGYLAHYDLLGSLVASTPNTTTTVYRSGGATVEGATVSWTITTNAACSEGSPFHTPWIYGSTTNGTKTFDLYIAHDNSDAAALTDADIWLEVEVMGTADSPLYTLNSNHRTITATASAHATDGTSTWNGDTFDYKQKLSKSGVTVGEGGLYRARVCVGKVLDATDNLVIDPLVTVS